MNLYELNSEWEYIYRLLDEENIDEDEVFAALERVEGDIKQKAVGYGKLIKNLEGQAAALDVEKKRIDSRKKACENAVSRLRSNLCAVMKNLGLTSIPTDLFSFKIQKNPPAVDIAEGTQLPEEYLIPQEPKIDKAAIKEDLKLGVIIEGCKLVQTESLRIR